MVVQDINHCYAKVSFKISDGGQDRYAKLLSGYPGVTNVLVDGRGRAVVVTIEASHRLGLIDQVGEIMTDTSGLGMTFSSCLVLPNISEVNSQ